MVDEERRKQTVLALAKAIALGCTEDILEARRALAAEQRAQEAHDFGERKAQEIAALETPQERWARRKAAALKILASNPPPPQSLLSWLVQRLNNAKTTAERRAARMAVQAELRKDNSSPRGKTIYKTAAPYQRYKNAKTPAEQREAFKVMAALYRKEHGK
jgi:hypothetical protein